MDDYLADKISQWELYSYFTSYLQIPLLRLLLTNPDLKGKDALQNKLRRCREHSLNKEKTNPTHSSDWESTASIIGKTVNSASTEKPLKNPVVGSLVCVEDENLAIKAGIVTDQVVIPGYGMVNDIYIGADTTIQQYSHGLTTLKPTSRNELISSSPPVTKDQQEDVEQRLSKSLSYNFLHAIELVNQVKPIVLSNEEQDLLTQSFPIIWATYTETQFVYIRSSVQEEIGLSGPQQLGKNIQVAFTPREHVQQVQSYMDKMLAGTGQQVKVLSIEAARYLVGKSEE